MVKKKQLSTLDKAILSTLAYSAVKNWPMTSWEIFRYLINPVKFGRIDLKEVSLKNTLYSIKKLETKGIVCEKSGFYYLKEKPNQKAFFLGRNYRDKLNDLKTKKIVKITRYLQFFPFIRGLFLSGSLAFGWSNKKSDLDLLIITKENQLWTTRFLLSGILTLVGLKRTKTQIKDRLCLNHFITDKNLKIPLYSLYNAQTYAHLIPLYVEQKTLINFLRANSWIKNYIFWGNGNYYHDIRQIPITLWGRSLKFLFEGLLLIFGGGLVLEKLLYRWQIGHIKKDPLTHKKGGRIVTDTSQIEFHPNSPERFHLKKYNQELKSLSLFSFEPERDSGLG